MKKIFIATFLILMIPVSASARGDITPNNIFNSVNVVRQDAKLQPLVRDSSLDMIAMMKLVDMRLYGYWSHVNPFTGMTPWSWFEKAKYPYVYAGENLAIGFDSTKSIVGAWVSSPTHKANIISTKYTHTGIATDGNLVVQVFASKPNK